MSSKTFTPEKVDLRWFEAFQAAKRALLKAPHLFFIHLSKQFISALLQVVSLFIWFYWSFQFIQNALLASPNQADFSLFLQWFFSPKTWLVLVILFSLSSMTVFLINNITKSGIFGTLRRGVLIHQKNSFADFSWGVGFYFFDYILLTIVRYLLIVVALLWLFMGVRTSLALASKWAYFYGSSGTFWGVFLLTSVSFLGIFFLFLISLWNGFAQIVLFFKQNPNTIDAYIESLHFMRQHLYKLIPLGTALITLWFFALISLFLGFMTIISITFSALIPLMLLLMALFTFLWLYSHAVLLTFYAAHSGLTTRQNLLEPLPRKIRQLSFIPGKWREIRDSKNPYNENNPNVISIMDIFPELFPSSDEKPTDLETSSEIANVKGKG